MVKVIQKEDKMNQQLEGQVIGKDVTILANAVNGGYSQSKPGSNQ